MGGNRPGPFSASSATSAAPGHSSTLKEEGELEDGEICDDDTDDRQLAPQVARPSGGSRRAKASRAAAAAASFRPAGHSLGSFSPCHRPQLGPSGPERLPPGPGCEASPRASFWERSHGALARLRYRGKPSDGRGGWDRGTGAGRDVGRPPQSRSNGPLCAGGRGFTNNRVGRVNRWCGLSLGSSRIAVRKQAYLMNKSENGVDESFEELLMKYKQIQLELECIRKEEKKALKPSEGSPQQEEASPAVSTLEETASRAESVHPEVPAQEQEEKKVFQAFNIRPLRQKLLTPAERDALNTRTDGEESESDLNISVVSKGSDGTPCKVHDKLSPDPRSAPSTNAITQN
uniref:Uncharacterized protein n=1 Tax=Electrophorus electricus TaxID=8005 RepID=A0AAY5E7T8_ELEEL